MIVYEKQDYTYKHLNIYTYMYITNGTGAILSHKAKNEIEKDVVAYGISHGVAQPCILFSVLLPVLVYAI